jgi:predicted RNA-binding protein YlxR (DUF448 family)
MKKRKEIPRHPKIVPDPAGCPMKGIPVGGWRVDVPLSRFCEPKDMGNKNIGERTCMGCGRKTHKSDLLRFVVDEKGKLLFDAAQQAPGRGGYLCRREACFDQAAKRRRVSVRFRREVSVDGPSLIQLVPEPYLSKSKTP